MDSNPKVNKTIKEFFKFKTFKKVETYKEATRLLVFFKSNLCQFTIMIKEEVNKELLASPDIYKIVYFKNSNPHDRRNTTLGLIKHITPCKRRY